MEQSFDTISLFSVASKVQNVKLMVVVKVPIVCIKKSYTNVDMLTCVLQDSYFKKYVL